MCFSKGSDLLAYIFNINGHKLQNWTLILSHEEYIDNQNRTTMKHERLESLSLLMIEADLLRQMNFEDLIKDFADKICRRKLFKV